MITKPAYDAALMSKHICVWLTIPAPDTHTAPRIKPVLCIQQTLTIWLSLSGAIVFMINLMFASWIKFPQPHRESAATMTIILGLGLCYMVGVNIRWARNVLTSPVCDSSSPPS